jgi:hypothetical protein
VQIATSKPRRSTVDENRNEADNEADNKALPRPIQLTPEEVQRIAAGTGALLPPGVTPPSIHGGIRIQA